MSIFPFITETDLTEIKIQELPIFKEVAYDYKKNCLQRINGKTFLVEKNEALKFWIYKVLHSKRFVYQAYSHKYGNELDNIVGKVLDKEILESEIKRYIVEAVIVNPYIQELSNFEFNHHLNSVYVQFDVDSIYDRFTFESEVYNA